MFDLLIKNASIVDGTGTRPGYSGDVAVTGDRIAEVGKISGAAKETVDAQGLTLTPGFVDIHTHYDGQASWDSVLMPSSQHGVTSIGMGNCGVGFAPVQTHHHKLLIWLLEGVEDIPGTALTEGLTWDWESFPDYLDALSRRKYSIDVGAHVPHAAVRTYVMGDRGADHTANPTDAEIQRMEDITYEAVRAGALGFSTSRSLAHKTIQGENIGTLTASERELSFAARALRRAGTGVLQMISDAYLTGDDAFAEQELRLIRHLSDISGRRPLSFSLMQSPNVPERWRMLLQHTAQLVSEGHHVRTQVAPRPIGLTMGLAGSVNPFSKTETYMTIAAEPLAEKVRIMSRPDVKAKMIAEHAALDRNDPLAFVLDIFNNLHRMSDPVDYEPLPSKSIGAEAERAGRKPVEYAYDVLLEDGGKRLLYTPIVNYVDGNLNSTYEMMTSPNSLFGLSDGGAHCGTVADASFPTTTISLWSRGNRDGKRISLEKLVHGYTQRNAQHVGWRDRGVIAPGYRADINLIDVANLSLSPPHTVTDLPSGASRFLQKAHGYKKTFKNGVCTFENGEWTGALPGKLLRGEQKL